MTDQKYQDGQPIVHAYYIDAVVTGFSPKGEPKAERAGAVHIANIGGECDEPVGDFSARQAAVVEAEVARLSLLRAAGVKLTPNLWPDRSIMAR
jgi:hypothetical protein